MEKETKLHWDIEELKQDIELLRWELARVRAQRDYLAEKLESHWIEKDKQCWLNESHKQVTGAF